jgi:putative protein kinase ArgK-like GTPase of G3E family
MAMKTTGHTIKQYSWSYVGDGVVMLTPSSYSDPIRYNKQSLMDVIETVKSNKTDYATEEAWYELLVMYRTGLAYFPAEDASVPVG